jgi:hypothetical protein
VLQSRRDIVPRYSGIGHQCVCGRQTNSTDPNKCGQVDPLMLESRHVFKGDSISMRRSLMYGAKDYTEWFRLGGSRNLSGRKMCRRSLKAQYGVKGIDDGGRTVWRKWFRKAGPIRPSDPVSGDEWTSSRSNSITRLQPQAQTTRSQCPLRLPSQALLEGPYKAPSKVPLPSFVLGQNICEGRDFRIQPQAKKGALSVLFCIQPPTALARVLLQSFITLRVKRNVPMGRVPDFLSSYTKIWLF